MSNATSNVNDNPRRWTNVVHDRAAAMPTDYKVKLFNGCESTRPVVTRDVSDWDEGWKICCDWLAGGSISIG